MKNFIETLPCKDQMVRNIILHNILIAIWNVHFTCVDKMNLIETQSAAGVVPPASICNDEMIYFSSMEVDNSIFNQY